MSRPLTEILDELKAALAEERLVLLAPEQARLEALDDVETCLQLETVAHALTTRAVKKVDDLDATGPLTGRTTKSWLREDLYMSKPEAGRRMKFVLFLDHFPILKAAYHGGSSPRSVSPRCCRR